MFLPRNPGAIVMYIIHITCLFVVPSLNPSLRGEHLPRGRRDIRNSMIRYQLLRYQLPAIRPVIRL